MTDGMPVTARLARFGLAIAAAAALGLSGGANLSAATYEVGPGKALSAVGDVPWEGLKAGDTVLIYWKPEGYHEKFNIGAAGTKDAPVTVRGVAGPNGELPVIDGRDATTRKGLTFNNEQRSILQIGPLKDSSVVPSNIVIENLEFRSCRAPYEFTDSTGAKRKYQEDSGPIRFNACDGVILRNSTIRDGGMGTLSSNSTRNITIEGCYYVDNGMETEKGAYVHQSYTETLGMIYQYNRFSHLRKDCTGTNLKDRSAGNVIRYNWIEGGNKEIDLPDWYDTMHTRMEIIAAGGKPDYEQWIKDDDAYRSTFIYGNVIIEPENDGNPEMITYGGDMGEPQYYHKGILYFYNNTVVSKRADVTHVFKLKTRDESCDARNNIFYTTAPGNTLAMMMYEGTLYMSHNWIKPGWTTSLAKEFNGDVIDDGTTATGESPGFVDEAAQDYHLAKGSPCIDAGRDLPPRAVPDNNVVFEYVKHQKSEPRPSDGKIDIGAFEYAGQK